MVWAQNDLPEKPFPPRLVNDLTGSTLSNSEQQSLERKLLAYEDTTSTQVAILIVNSLNGYEGTWAPHPKLLSDYPVWLQVPSFFLGHTD